jgi:signal transduction histidine kinase
LTATRAGAYVLEALRWLPSDGQSFSTPAIDKDEPGDGTAPLELSENYRVLLAEDNADMREYIQRLLTPQMEVIAVTNGQEALARVLEDPPDLVLSDVMMPVMDGFALLKVLRSNPNTNTLPVILLSARAGEESRVEGVGAGADDYLVKPFSARELLARVSAHLKMARLRKEALEALRRREADLRRVNEDLNQFAYSASHDLREPLRNVSIYAQLLQRKLSTAPDDETREFLGFVVEGAHRTETMLSDLLKYTQAAADTTSEQTDAAAALRNTLDTLKVSIQESGAAVTTGDLPTLPISPVHLIQLFQNLIGNAIKYRDPAISPRIHVSAARRGAQWEFSVKDNGIGIAPEYHQRVFGIFKRLHSADQYSGTGIGLAIAQRIVERYGGTIWVESELGTGSTFLFTLPAGESI